MEVRAANDSAGVIAMDTGVGLVCGGAYRQLTSRHLRSHHLTSDDYRQRFGLDPGRPLVGLSLLRRYGELAAARGRAEWARQRALLMASSSGLTRRRRRGSRASPVSRTLTFDVPPLSSCSPSVGSAKP